MEENDINTSQSYKKFIINNSNQDFNSIYNEVNVVGFGRKVNICNQCGCEKKALVGLDHSNDNEFIDMSRD